MLSLPLPPGFGRETARRNPSTPLRRSRTSILKRVPLQELAISATGALKGCRLSTFRPLPSLEKENIQAVFRAHQSRHGFLVSRLQDIARRIRRAHRDQRRTRPARRRASPEPERRIADQSPAMPPPRLSMPEISDDSESEPDLSILELARARPGDLARRIDQPDHDVHAQLEAEDTSIEDDIVEDDIAEDGVIEGVEGEEHEEEAAEDQVLPDPASMGLKEISNLGRFTVSSHKQGNGVEELRSDDLNLYWQSDGPQPHRLTIYFVKRVGIRDLRFYVNYSEDESYTPTNIIFKSGTSENNLIEFAHLTLESPVGWQQVSINGAGGGPDGNTLVSYVLQMQILENHQNGKDTHLRGIKIYAFDADSGQAPGRENNPMEDVVEMMDSTGATRDGGEQVDENTRLSGLARRLAETRIETGEAGFTVPDFMRDPEIR